MALARVQATPKATAQQAAAATFAAPPTIGNGILVGVQISGTPTTSCADNRGNTYTLAKSQAGVNASAAIYYCAAITTTGTPFTVTVSTTVNAAMVALAVEVSGVGGGLAVDQTFGGGAAGTGANALTNIVGAANLVGLAVVAVSATQGSITVSTGDGLSPGWTQEAEELSYGPWQSGEIDSRVLAAASGNIGASWTWTASGQFADAVAVFKATPGGAAVETAQSYVWGPV